MNDSSTLISPIDVAVCDPDVLWRVEHMNVIKGLNVREFASAADAVPAVTPGHWMVVVVGPTSPRDELAAVAASGSSTAWIRLVVVDRNDGRDLSSVPNAPTVDQVLGINVGDADFTAAVLEQLARRDEPANPDAGAADDAGADAVAGSPDGSPDEPPTAPDATSSGPATGVGPVVVAESVAGADQEAGAGPATGVRPADHARPTSEVIVVTSAKGGEGASTIALNLAIEIAGLPRRVALVDGDPRFGDLALDLGLTPAVAHADGKSAPQPDQGRAAMMSRDESGVLLVQLPPASRAPASGSVEDGWETLAEVISMAGEQADVVVVDVPIEALLDHDELHHLGPILVVTTGHTASVKNALLAAERLGIACDAGLVVNEISHHRSSVTAEAIARSVGLPLRAHLPYDAALVRAAGTPDARLVAGRHSRYGRAIRALRQGLATGEVVATG